MSSLAYVSRNRQEGFGLRRLCFVDGWIYLQQKPKIPPSEFLRVMEVVTAIFVIFICTEYDAVSLPVRLFLTEAPFGFLKRSCCSKGLRAPERKWEARSARWKTNTHGCFDPFDVLMEVANDGRREFPRFLHENVDITWEHMRTFIWKQRVVGVDTFFFSHLLYQRDKRIILIMMWITSHYLRITE